MVKIWLIALAALSFLLAPAAAEEPGQAPAATEDASAPELAGTRLDRLFIRLAELSDAESHGADALANDVMAELSRHESPTAELLLSRARAARRAGEAGQAMDHVTRLIAFQPDFSEAWHFRATLYFEQEAVGLAMRDLRQALRLEPRHFSAWAGLGVILEATGRNEQAAAAYRSALAWHPHMQAARAQLEELEKTLNGQPL